MRIVSILFVAICITGMLASAAAAGEARICEGCGKSIPGAGFETQGRFYHKQCFLCDFCDQAIGGGYVEYGGKNYHEFCFKRHVALICMVCGEVIQGEYLIDHWGNTYHRRHENSLHRCNFCNRFIAGAFIEGMVTLPDGRMLCNRCAPSAVTRSGEARVLMRDVSEELARHGLEVSTKAIELQLVGQRELRRLSGSSGSSTTGFVDYVVEKNLFGGVTHQKITISILHGMPRIQAAGAIAHELTHVWQFQQGRLHVDKALSEGSANYAAYLVLTALGGGEAAFLIQNMLSDSDPVYGEGFRRVKRYAERRGTTAWLELLKSKKPMISSF